MVTSISNLIPGDDVIQTISGTVVNVFDDEFILEDETGTILVDAYDLLEKNADLDLEVGQELTVVGDLDDEDFDARSISLTDDTPITSPPPSTDTPGTVTNISELIRQDDLIQTISGTVVNVFDDEFILEDETGTILVDAYDLLEKNADLDLEVGQELTVVGDLDDEDFDARSISLTDDTPITSPPPSTDTPGTVTNISELIRQDDLIQTISGTVVNVFDDEFILEDETGTILVDAYDLLEKNADLDLEVGQELTVVGDLDDEDFDARSISLTDDTPITSPPPSTDTPGTVTNISELIRQDDLIQTISGTVVNVFDDEFILEDETGTILVDAYDLLEKNADLDLEVGQELTVVGDLDDEDFDARSISLTDDTPITSPPPSTDTPGTVTNISELIRQDDLIQTISGTVVNVFDDEFILEDETGTILVDAYDLLEKNADLDLEVGQELTVVGDLDDEDFDARSITSPEINNSDITLINFASEETLGTQDEIVILNHKIESIDIYSGSSGENFGGEWLDDFDSTISSQEQVDLALNNLVDNVI